MKKQNMNSNESKSSLLDFILDFTHRFGCNLIIKQDGGKHIVVEVSGCIDKIQHTNQMIKDALCPNYSFEAVLVKDERYLFECVERDMTLVIEYKCSEKNKKLK